MTSDLLQMSTTRRQKKARKSTGIEMLSDIENLDIMLGENHFERNERYESLNGNHARRSESASGDEFENDDENKYSDYGNVGPSTNACYGRNPACGNFNAEINRLSSELISRISRELDVMMNSVSVQIERAINDTISSQVLPQIQCAITTGSGHTTRKGWNVPTERPDTNSEALRNAGTRATREVRKSQIVRMTIAPRRLLTTW